ncbi:MAG: amino acid ABC transporter substrate-binding protein [Brevinematia bacterium]
MKKVLFLIVIIFLFFISCSKNETDDSWKRIKKNGKIIIGIDEFFPPMTFKEDDNFAGIDIDLAKETFSRLGVKVEFVPVVWAEIIDRLTNGGIDIIWSGLSITEERKKVINFSIPYILTRQIIIVPFDSDINTRDDLKNKILGVQEGTSSEKLLKKDRLYKTLKKVNLYKDVETELNELYNGKINAVVIDEIVAKYFLSKHHKKLKIIQSDLDTELFAVGIRKEDKALKEKIDKTLSRLMKNGIEAKILKKWIGETQLLSDYLRRLKEAK